MDSKVDGKRQSEKLILKSSDLVQMKTMWIPFVLVFRSGWTPDESIRASEASEQLMFRPWQVKAVKLLKRLGSSVRSLKPSQH